MENGMMNIVIILLMVFVKKHIFLDVEVVGDLIVIHLFAIK